MPSNEKEAFLTAATHILNTCGHGCPEFGFKSTALLPHLRNLLVYHVLACCAHSLLVHTPFSHAQVAHGVICWGDAPHEAVFDFSSLQIDFGAGVPEEVIAYMTSLPDELVSRIGGLIAVHQAFVEVCCSLCRT